LATGDPAIVGQAAPQPSTFGTNARGAGNPRSGGMQVIDLTGAPPPPGYRPLVPNFNNQYPAVPQPHPNWQQAPPSQAPQNQSLQNQSYPGPGVRVITAPGAAEIADRLQPVPSDPGTFGANPSSVQPGFPRTANAPIPGPSTEPVNSGSPNGTQQNLPWRQPGARF
jgi:hypothetical protein